MRHRFAIAVALLILLAALHARAQTTQKYWLFAYFREPATQGIYLAISRDGYHFTPLNHDQPWLKPAYPGELMRDVDITRGPDHMFRMVWTWGWHGDSFGYAESPDLIHWSAQREIPIMRNFPSTHNVWAPVIYWDASRGKWMVLWSSTIDNIGLGNRIYYSLTSDFHHFTIPSLFYDPGYVVIDAKIYHGAKKYYLIFKDQDVNPLRYQVRYATGLSYEGPWSQPSPPLTPSWSEGPSAIHAGREYIVYYDHYRAPMRYEGVESTDWIHWKSINDQIDLPAHCKHGSFLWISAAEAARLKDFQPRRPGAPASRGKGRSRIAGSGQAVGADGGNRFHP